jgi:hypothetical protein
LTRERPPKKHGSTWISGSSGAGDPSERWLNKVYAKTSRAREGDLRTFEGAAKCSAARETRQDWLDRRAADCCADFQCLYLFLQFHAVRLVSTLIGTLSWQGARRRVFRLPIRKKNELTNPDKRLPSVIGPWIRCVFWVGLKRSRER